jgi:PAS domain S-box-containing protein
MLPVVRLSRPGGAGRAGISKPRAPACSIGGAGASAGGLEEASRAALRVSEIRYRRLFETARDGVLLLDPDTRKITDVNPFMIEFLGYTHREFVGKELWEIGLLKDHLASQEMFRELREKHYIRYEDLPLQSVAGRTRQVEVVANLYQEDTHSVIQCNIRDITERKQAERELVAAKNEISRHAADLQEKVTERTAQLRETIGELEAFSYSISHDMRSPLLAMRGFAEILLRNYSTQLDAKGISYLEKIGVAAGRMDTLIQEVLAYTRVLRAEVHIETVDLDALVRQVIETYPRLQTACVEIRIQGVLPKVLGGEASLAQCLSNLLTNAVKFVAPETKPRVNIRAETRAGDIRLWVEDNGIGIAPTDQLRIFKMFERLDRPAAYEGTGLGLTIVRKAVERMGGQMGVESEVGRGSKFWIQLKGAEEGRRHAPSPMGKTPHSGRKAFRLNVGCDDN